MLQNSSFFSATAPEFNLSALMSGSGKKELFRIFAGN
jgi:hypothetical protein